MMMILLLALLVVLLSFFIQRAKKNNGYFSQRGIAFGQPKFLLGTSYDLIKKKISLYEYVQFWYNQFPDEKIVGLFEFTKPFYLIRDPEICHELCVKQFDSFPDHKNVVDEKIDPYMGNTLMSLKGQKWKEMRNVLSPAFTGSKMRSMFHLVQNCITAAFETIETEADTQSREMKSFFSNFTIDIIATCAFALEVNSFENPQNDLQRMAKKFADRRGLKTLLKFIGFSIFPRLMKLLGVRILPPELADFFHSTIIETFDHRRKNGISRPDMIQLLMEAVDEKVSLKKSSEGHVWTDDVIIAQCLTFYLAGFKTTSTALSFAAYELALNSEIQQKLRREFEELKANDVSPSFDEIHKMKYLDKFVFELLRKWPPAPAVERSCVKAFSLEVGGKAVTIEQGIDLLIPVYAFHRDPRFFENPEKFDPDRFDEENEIDMKAYLPFGLGPRRCIGSRFAIMVIKSVLYHLLLRYELRVNEATQIPLKFKTGVSVDTEKGIWIDLRKIH